MERAGRRRPIWPDGPSATTVRPMMAEAIWNHAPADVVRHGGRRHFTARGLTHEQAADLFAFFYAFRYFEEPGDAARGKKLFEAKAVPAAMLPELRGAA